MAEAARTVLNLEADVAGVGSPVDGDCIVGHGGIDTGGSIASHTAALSGGEDADPVLTGPVGAAVGLDVELVGSIVKQAGDHVAVGGGQNGGAGALVEAFEAVLNGPGLSHRVSGPVEGDAVGGHVAGGKAGDVGAGGGGEGHSVAPVALQQVNTAEGAVMKVTVSLHSPSSRSTPQRARMEAL